LTSFHPLVTIFNTLPFVLESAMAIIPVTDDIIAAAKGWEGGRVMVDYNSLKLRSPVKRHGEWGCRCNGWVKFRGVEIHQNGSSVVYVFKVL
jgi:hypothetical protein